MPHSRSFLFLLALVAVLFATSCRREETPDPAPAGEPVSLAAENAARGTAADEAPAVQNPCPENGKGIDNRAAPIVCVDDTGEAFTVSPEPVYVWDREGKEKPVRPVMLWFTKSGSGDLRLEFHKSDSGQDCVEPVRCNGNGRCMTRVAVEVPQGETEVRCKYDVWVEGSTIPRLDPDAVIVPCCS